MLLGVSGSIAAFKAASVASELVKRGIEVRCTLTPGAARFIAPLTFEALTGYPAPSQVWEEQEGGGIGHIALAHWADVLAVAPASAGCIARLALGLPQDLLGAVALAYSGPLVLAPAMETGMFRHPATQAHLETLGSRGAAIVGPVEGRLASGEWGEGRMAEPGEIVEAILGAIGRRRDMIGMRVLVSAGPTIEPLDPVRYLGNRSSGKMGLAIAQEARERGADVLVVAGPVDVDLDGLPSVRVETTEEMRDAILSNLEGRDVLVMAAAVADFRPHDTLGEKRKRSGPVTLELVPTPDIAAEAVQRFPDTFHVAFALETADPVAAAEEKLRRKGVDLVVANGLSQEHNPFGSDTNEVAFVTADGVRRLPLLPKREVAARLWDEVLDRLKPRAH